MISFPDAPTEGQVFTAGTASWLYTSGKWTAAPAPAAKYVIGCFVPDMLTSNQVLLLHSFSRAVTIPANFGSYLGHGSQAGGNTTATASTVITVSKAAGGTPGTFTTVGTITFPAGTGGPTFATAASAPIICAESDILRLRAPATPDATFAGFFCTLVGSQS